MKKKVVLYDVELDDLKHPKLVARKRRTYETEDEEPFDHIAVARMLCKCFRLADMAEEYVYAMAFTTRGGLLGVFELAHGTYNSAKMTFRELMQRLLLVGASGYILAHNHPSGDPTPSQADIDLCGHAVQMGKDMGIPCLDCIIVGRDLNDGGCLVASLRQANLMTPEGKANKN